MSVKIISLAFILVILSASSVSAVLDSGIPETLFEQSTVRNFQIGGGEFKLDIFAFHQSSVSWVLFFRNNPVDIYPYDNLSVTVECDDMGAVSFDLTEYQSWVNEGILSVLMSYDDASESINYNDVVFTAKNSECLISIGDHGAGSYVNNSHTYSTLEVEMIPYLSTMEDIDCSDVDSAELTIVNELSLITGMMVGSWNILWLIYSIFIVIFAVFMIPISIFILMRWAIFRLTGFKLVERKDRGEISV